MAATKIRLPLLLLVVASAALTVAAGLMLFSTFMFYDDEGYVLLSLRNYVTHGHLYGAVYSQYGPFPYVLYYVLHALGLPLTHMAERYLTLLAWSSCATLSAWTVWRATRSTALMLAVLASVFVYLWIMVSEPCHPGGLIALATAILSTFGCRWLARGNWGRWAALAGAGCCILVLTKINIGAFATCSTLAVLLLYAQHDRLRRAAPWILAAGAAILPWLLMRALLEAPWVQIYASVFVLAGVPACLAAARGATPGCGRRTWWMAGLGAGVALIVVLGVTFARGTTPAQLVQGVILGPLRHPVHFSLPFKWPPGVVFFAGISFAIFCGLRVRLARLPAWPVDDVVAALRLLAAIMVAVMITRFPTGSPTNLVFAFSASCLWFFLWPLAHESAAMTRAQTWLGLLFLGQWLHVFPVPGSQIAWGSFLFIPLAAIGGWNAAVWLAQRRLSGRRIVRALRVGLQLGLVVLAAAMSWELAKIGRRYLESRSLALPGAESLRLPDSATALFRLLAFNASAHSDMVFTLPGMFSFNLWTGLPTPTLTNVTHWFSLLSDAEQQEIIASLEAHPNACVIVQEEHVQFLKSRGLGPTGPLYDYITRNFEPAFAIDRFEFRVRRGRSIAPLLTAELFQQVPTKPEATAPQYNSLIKMTLLLSPNEQVGAIEIANMDYLDAPHPWIDGRNCQVEVTPIDLAGHPRGPAEPRTFPFSLHGPSVVSIYFNRGNTELGVHQSLIIVHNAAGAEVALVRVRP